MKSTPVLAMVPLVAVMLAAAEPTASRPADLEAANPLRPLPTLP